MCCHGYRVVTRVIAHVLSWLQGCKKSASMCCHGYRVVTSDSACVVMVSVVKIVIEHVLSWLVL